MIGCIYSSVEKPVHNVVRHFSCSEILMGWSWCVILLLISAIKDMRPKKKMSEREVKIF